MKNNEAKEIKTGYAALKNSSMEPNAEGEEKLWWNGSLFEKTCATAQKT